MNVTMRKVISAVTAFVLAAILATTATEPAFAKKPQSRAKPKTDFTVNAMLFLYPWGVAWEGDFNANGAIDDQGDAYFDGAHLDLWGEQGTIGVSISGDTFKVDWATGDYAGLDATGSAQVSERHGKDFRKMKVSLRGTILTVPEW